MLDNHAESCRNGSSITDEKSCKEACDELNIIIKETHNGYVCYKKMQGNCYQDGQIRDGDSLVCEEINLNHYIV